MTVNLAAVGTPTFAAGKFGNAATTAAGAYFTTSDSSQYRSSTGLTVEYWAKTSSASGYQIVFGRAGNEWFGFNAGKACTSVGSLTAATSTADGAWHHYAWVLDNTNLKLYIDGVASGSIASTVSSQFWPASGGGNVVSVGAWASASTGTAFSFAFLGSIDELHVSKVARYTAAFTAPTAAPTADASTLALYRFEADGTDSNGGTPVADTTAPSVPTGLTATAGNGQIGLSWTASTDNVAVTGYKLYRGGTLIASPSGTSYTDTGLTNGTASSYTVAATDAAGNTSAQTSAVSATPSASASNGTIAPNDANIVYSPYNWQVTSSTARTNCSGAYLKAAVKGSPTAITATFDLSGISGSIAYRATVDGTTVTTGTIAASISIALPANGWPEHLVEIVFPDLYGGTDKWGAAPTRSVKFTGFTLAPTSALSNTFRRRPLNILCFGDSIAEGYSAPSSGATDGRLGWAYSLGQLLGAEVGVVGYSAQGYTKTGVGSVPAFSSTYNQLSSGVARSFTTPAEPDLVLINMGTNDNGADITAAMTTVLNGILAATTTAKVVIVQQWNGTLYKTSMQAVIAACSAPSRVTYLDTTGWLATADTADNTHPWGYINVADLAPRIATAVRSLLTGATTFTPKRYVNVAGVAKAIA